MNIAFLAHDKRKELMIQFCTAYKSILSKHSLFATATTGRLVAEATGLPITLLLSHKQGGHQQVNARIAYNEIDMVLLFTNPDAIDPWDGQQMLETIRFCDKHNVPVATNLASAEMKRLFDWQRVCREVRVVTPEFRIREGDRMKTVVVYAKMCRGEMTRHILRHRIADPEGLKTFEWEGFRFDPERSRGDEPHFTLR